MDIALTGRMRDTAALLDADNPGTDAIRAATLLRTGAREIEELRDKVAAGETLVALNREQEVEAHGLYLWAFVLSLHGQAMPDMHTMAHVERVAVALGARDGAVAGRDGTTRPHGLRNFASTIAAHLST